MNIREQLSILTEHEVKFVVVGGQAGVLRQAIEFSHDLDVIIEASRQNAALTAAAVREITGINADVDLILGRDFPRAIGHRIRYLVLHDRIVVDEIVLSLYLEPDLANLCRQVYCECLTFQIFS